MAVVQVSIADVKLTSSWRCYQNSNGSYGSTSPSLKDITQTVQIPGIPAGASVQRAVISYNVEASPNTGAELCTINGAAAGWRAGSYSIELPAQSGSQFSLTFAFRAYGNSHQHVQSHSASLTFRQIVLTFEYTDPYSASDWTVNTPSVDAGNPVSVTISPKGSGYTHHLRLEFGGYAAEASLPAGVNVASLPTQLEWLNAISAATSGVGSITMTTYYGGTAIGQSSKSVTITAPASVVPALQATANRNLAVGGVTYPDVTGGYVQQKSAVHAFFNSFAGAYGSQIVSHSINVGGKSDAAFNTDGTSLYSPLLPDAGNIPITFRVTDSRGRTAQKVITIQVEGYAPPRASGFAVYRTDENGNANDNGTRGRYEFQKTFTDLGGRNSCTATITAAGSEATDVAESGWLVPGAVKELDVLLSYDVQLKLTDVYGSTTTVATIPSINFAMHFSADGTSAWIGEACQHSNAFGVSPKRNVYFYGKELRTLIPAHNLLDNSDFRNPVNQRGQASYYGAGYTIDRWTAAEGATMNVIHGRWIEVNNYIQQRLPKGVLDSTKQYTLAWMTGDGVLHVSQNNVSFTSIGYGYEYDEVYLNLERATIAIVWAALYEGEYTAETLPPYIPKGYTAELVECQRYFYLVPNSAGIAYTGYFSSSTNFRMTIPMPVPMRVNPTISAYDVTKATIFSADNSFSATAMSVNQRHGNGIQVDVTMSGATAWTVGAIRLNTATYLSAEL